MRKHKEVTKNFDLIPRFLQCIHKASLICKLYNVIVKRLQQERCKD